METESKDAQSRRARVCMRSESKRFASAGWGRVRGAFSDTGGVAVRESHSFYNVLDDTRPLDAGSKRGLRGKEARPL